MSGPRPFRFPVFPAALIALLLLAISTCTMADEIAPLKAFFSTLEDLSGTFVQQSENENGLTGGTRRGHFLLQRPGRFRWSYERPERQIIIANGDRLMIYDQDLEQLTIKALDPAMVNSPAGLLVAHEAVDKLFDIRRLPSNDNTEWFELTPKQGSSGFRYTRIGISEGRIQAMIIEDEFSQRTRFSFSQVNSHPVIPPEAFVINPPPGTDVMDETQGMPQ